MKEPYLINPVSRKARTSGPHKKRRASIKKRLAASLTQRRKHMAKKRRKLAGAALKAHLKKIRGKRRNPRRRHSVKRHHRSGGRVHSYGRKGASVKRHMSNPHKRRSHRRRYRRNPGMKGLLGQAGSTSMEGLTAVGIFLGALIVVGFANRQASKVGFLSSGWGNLAAKIGVGLAGVMAAKAAARRGWISPKNTSVAIAAAWAPLALGLLNRFVPPVAAQISLEDNGDEMAAQLEMSRGNRLSDYTIDAELGAQLEAGRESESSMF